MRFFAACLILAIALILQLTVVAHGIVFDFAFAALIAFAAVFNFLELAVLVLLGVFMLNWQPSLSRTLLVIALYPILVAAAHKFLRWQGWFGVLASIVVGFIILAAVANPAFLVNSLDVFFADTIVGMLFGVAVFAGIKKA